MVCSECFMYRSDPNDPKFGNRGLEQSKCPVCNNWSEIVCRSYHQMNTVEEKKEEIRKVVHIFDRKSSKLNSNSQVLTCSDQDDSWIMSHDWSSPKWTVICSIGQLVNEIQGRLKWTVTYQTGRLKKLQLGGLQKWMVLKFKVNG